MGRETPQTDPGTVTPRQFTAWIDPEAEVVAVGDEVGAAVIEDLVIADADGVAADRLGADAVEGAPQPVSTRQRTGAWRVSRPK